MREDVPRVRPLGLGAKLDEAIWLFRDHFRLYFGIMLFAALPVGLLYGLAEDGAKLYFTLTAGERFPPWGAMEGLALEVEILIAAVFSGVELIAVRPFHSAAVIMATSAVCLGARPGAAACARRAMARYGRFFTANLLFLALLALGFMLCIAPGILFMLFCYVYLHVVVLEDGPLIGSLGRAKELMYGSKGAVFILTVLSFLLHDAVMAVQLLIPPGFGGAVLAGAASAFHWTFVAVLSTVVYFSARARLEHLDLDLRVARIDGDGGDEGAAPVL